MRVWPVSVAWVLTRGFVLVLLCTQERMVTGDVTYYGGSLAALYHYHVAGTLTEYPVPALLLLWLPYALLGLVGHVGAYVAVIAALGVATDLFFLVMLVRAREWRPEQPRTYLGITAAEWVWLAAAPALGATTYARFDLVPGILVGLALLYAVHRPGVAAAFGAVATGVKYWPFLVLPALAAPRTGRRRVVATVAVAGVVLAAGSLVAGGWHRLWTPLTYQSDRGLQIESVAATPAMLAWANGADGYTVTYTTWKAYDVGGPVVGPLLVLASVAAVLALVLVAAGWALAWSRLRDAPPARSIEPLVWLVFASVAGFVVTNKVLSPQYLLWLLPAAAAGVLLLDGRPGLRALLTWSALLLGAAALTHEVFPRHYGYVLGRFPGTGLYVGLLAARNVLLAGLFAYAAWRAARLLVPPRVPEAARRPALADD